MREEQENKLLIRVIEKGKIEGVSYFGIERGHVQKQIGKVVWQESECQVFSIDINDVMQIASNMVENLKAEGIDAELVSCA